MPTAPDLRVRSLNDKEILSGDYVLYWMQQSQRTEHNPALDLAIREANRLRLSVVVGFGLTDAYPRPTCAITVLCSKELPMLKPPCTGWASGW